jgi:transglutaminase superfamily protein
MKRIRITHRTEYYYHIPVTFGPHRALLRPREGHDVHIDSSLLKTEPAANVHWLRDTHGNSVAVLNFAGCASRLSLLSEVDIDLYELVCKSGCLDFTAPASSLTLSNCSTG